MNSYQRTTRRVHLCSVGAALAAAAVLGVGTARADTADDVIGQALAAASSDDEYVPAELPYSTDPSDLLSPVYTIKPVGAPDVSVTSDSGEVWGTQDFDLTALGIPLDSFTGSFEYSPVSSVLDLFGSPYVDFIEVTGVSGTLVPEDTGFLVTEFGFGYGNVLEESMNAAGTSATIGDFVLTPFGDWNISPVVDLLSSTAFTDWLTSVTDSLSGL